MAWIVVGVGLALVLLGVTGIGASQDATDIFVLGVSIGVGITLTLIVLLDRADDLLRR